jgi:hypothetical protein
MSVSPRDRRARSAFSSWYKKRVDSGGILRTLDDAARLWVTTGGGPLPISGRSMRPTFEDAARVWMKESARVRFGDILVYSSGSYLVVHRVVGRRKGPRYRTKGDGLAYLDTMIVPEGRVIGVVSEIERRGERWRLDGAGSRAYGALLASLSAVEGFFYRFAWRLDRSVMRLLAPGRGPGGPMILRRALDATGRLGIGLFDRLFFGVFHARAPGVK